MLYIGERFIDSTGEKEFEIIDKNDEIVMMKGYINGFPVEHKKRYICFIEDMIEKNLLIRKEKEE